MSSRPSVLVRMATEDRCLHAPSVSGSRELLLVASTGLALGGCFLLSRAPRPDSGGARLGPRPVRGGVPGLPRGAGGRAVRPESPHGQGHPLRAMPHAGRPSELRAARAGRQVRRLPSTRVPADPGEQALRDPAAARAGRRPGRADHAPPRGIHRGHGRAAGTSWATRPRASWAVACARRVTTTSIGSASAPCSGPTSASDATRIGRRTSPISTPGLTNRCTQCHVRAGTTESGQVVNTHRFARPGEE